MSHNDSVDDFREAKDPENLTKNLTADLHVSRQGKFSTPRPPRPRNRKLRFRYKYAPPAFSPFLAVLREVRRDVSLRLRV